ncbi:radical SAM protein [Lentzea sp.]|uniref:radical SAM protein n=1 Tax=Lentzea sp. TaxID=56099 RepID=UPI002ED2E0A0
MDITWDVAHARLSHDRMLHIARALISMRPEAVTLGGGEPLDVPGLFEIVGMFRSAGIDIVLRTNGKSMHPSMVRTLLESCARIEVCAMAFTHAMHALRLLDIGASRLGSFAVFGLDATGIRRGFDRLEEFCATTAFELPRLGFIAFSESLGSDHAQYLQSLAPQSVRVTVETANTSVVRAS